MIENDLTSARSVDQTVANKFTALFDGSARSVERTIALLHDLQQIPSVMGYRTRLSWLADFSDARSVAGEDLNLPQALGSITGMLKWRSAQMANGDLAVALSVVKSEVADV